MPNPETDVGAGYFCARLPVGCQEPKRTSCVGCVDRHTIVKGVPRRRRGQR